LHFFVFIEIKRRIILCETMIPYHIIWFQLMTSIRMSLEFVSNMSFKLIWVVSFCDANMFSFLFWGEKHGKQSGATCTNGSRCSYALFNVITHLHELLFSFSIYFFFDCLFVFESCYSFFFSIRIGKKPFSSLFIQGSCCGAILLKCTTHTYYK
jgi:hypothetical protein